MHTTINGQDAEWTPEIEAAWEATEEGRPEGKITRANYYDATSRNAGKGFVYTVTTGDGPWYVAKVFTTEISK